MNATTPHPAIAKINGLIDESRALEADFLADKTLELAQSALESAKAAVLVAEGEDDSIDPEQLVDRRIEARRQAEIAGIRLERAKKAMESRKSEVNHPIIRAGKIAAEALREVVEPSGRRLESELRRIIGDHSYERDSGHYKALIYRKGEALFGHARQMEAAASVQGLNQAIALIEDARRLG